MMHITPDEYVALLNQTPPQDFELLKDIAANRINMLIGGRTNDTSLSEFCHQQLNKAICMQIYYLDINGGIDGISSKELSSVTLGKFSYSTGADRSSSTGADRSSSTGADISPLAMQYLYASGFMYRGVGVIR